MQLSGGTFRLEAEGMLANDRHGVVLTSEHGQRNEKTLNNQAVHVWDIRDGGFA